MPHRGTETDFELTTVERLDVKAAVRATVKRVLRNRDVRAEDFDQLVKAVMEQAEAPYADWPLVA